ncbi:MAG: NADH-quinone oxidoreductase subunit L [Clostridiales Family XIII bacterium]|nr:NADH-quinone oxidoreductase subunit L [Clostridiales Family XIII bacterium]
MELLTLLIAMPLVAAIILLIVKNNSIRRGVVFTFGAAIALLSIVFAVIYLGGGPIVLWEASDSGFSLFAGIPGSELGEHVSFGMFILEMALSAIIIFLCVRYRKIVPLVLTLIQVPLVVWFEFTKSKAAHEATLSFVKIDSFSIIMILIIGVIGSLVCVHAAGYMKDDQEHADHEGRPDRRRFFFFVMFAFLSAMFGVVVSDNLSWMLFFWECTTICSFFLIGYTKDEVAIKNSFKALAYNMIGGIAFITALIVMASYESIGTLSLSGLLDYGVGNKAMGGQDPVVNLVVGLLVVTGATKAAQMPFSTWLLGTMVAPAPTSALLHSSTMVKAGVFLIIRLAPLLGVSELVTINLTPGLLTVMLGGVTFLFASLAMISQTNAKRALAYSTIANLGLIVACAGVGTEASVWAGIMLIIFHAVTKCLLFLCVGTVEHRIGSKDIEEMDGLLGKLPKITSYMIIGCAAMFLAPFGMLVSKWAALKAFVEAGNFWIVMFLAFGSAVFLFAWTKWVGKLTAVMPDRENLEKSVSFEESFVNAFLALLTIITAVSFPWISDGSVIPYLNSAFALIPTGDLSALSKGNMIIMVVMVLLLIILTLLFYGKGRKKNTHLYMAGAGKGDDLTYTGSMQKTVHIQNRNYYLNDIFPEDRMVRLGTITSAAVLAAVAAYYVYIGLALYTMLASGGFS